MAWMPPHTTSWAGMARGSQAQATHSGSVARHGTPCSGSLASDPWFWQDATAHFAHTNREKANTRCALDALIADRLERAAISGHQVAAGGFDDRSFGEKFADQDAVWREERDFQGMDEDHYERKRLELEAEVPHALRGGA